MRIAHLVLSALLPALVAGRARKGFKITEPKTLLPLVRRSEQSRYQEVRAETTRSSSAHARVEQARKAEKRIFSQAEIGSWPEHVRRDGQLAWEVQIAYEGNTFFDEWDFYTQPDPTHGCAHLCIVVNYLDRDTAFARGNVFWTGDGSPGIQADHWSYLPVGTPRDSIRITTKSLFAGGLFIVDLRLSPWGCGVWPAIWTLGYEGEWPSSGEIDILEGIQAMRQNHTMPGCEINQTAGLYSGSLGNTNCDSSQGGTGCTIISPSWSSFAETLNLAGGGVFAMLWSDNGIRFWDWNRSMIPIDVNTGHPTPETWGIPSAAWDASMCDPYGYFQPQVLVINIDLCGDWAGDLYSSFPYCPDTCAEYIANPLNLNNSVMLLNSIKVYQQTGLERTAQQANNSQNLTGAGGAQPLNASQASILASPTTHPAGHRTVAATDGINIPNKALGDHRTVTLSKAWILLVGMAFGGLALLG
ncbi:hypothetical protein IAU60_000259 [Kwoniella sp. DSM 27419]